jgi:hypothetical protein
VNRYRVLLPLLVKPHRRGHPPQFHTPDAAYGQGEEFDYEFTAEEEAQNLASGLLEIVPRTYKVVSDSVVHDTQPGETFDAALPIGVEEHLVVSGHIKRVDPPAPKPKTTKTKS